jgi:hypothetical protein
MRIQYDEEHYKKRQTEYHELLSQVSSWKRELEGAGITTIPLTTRWMQELERHFTGVSLICLPELLGKVNTLREVIERSLTSVPDEDYYSEYREAYNGVVVAMRREINPNLPGPGTTTARLV